jgi:hypothetical protein
MKALVRFGVPAEVYWPYKISKFDDEPPAFCGAAHDHQEEDSEG